MAARQMWMRRPIGAALGSEAEVSFTTYISGENAPGIWRGAREGGLWYGYGDELGSEVSCVSASPSVDRGAEHAPAKSRRLLSRLKRFNTIEHHRGELRGHAHDAGLHFSTPWL